MYCIAPPTDADFSQQLCMLCTFEIYGAFDEGWALLLASSSRLPWTALGSTPASGLSVLCTLTGSRTPAKQQRHQRFCACVNDCHQHSPLTESRKQICTGKTGTNWAPLFSGVFIPWSHGSTKHWNTETW